MQPIDWARTMNVDLVDRLEADLTAGRLRPGEWLRQADIEEMYGATRFDVRTALMDLRARYLIEHIPNRGYRVIDLSEREREELIDTRVVLEAAAARLAAGRASRDDIRELEEIVQEFERQMHEVEVAALRQLNARFHDRFYAISGNQILTERIRALRQRGLPGPRSRGWRSIAAIEQSHQDHVQMVRLLKARDAENLGELVHDHLNRFRQFNLI